MSEPVTHTYRVWHARGEMLSEEDLEQPLASFAAISAAQAALQAACEVVDDGDASDLITSSDFDMVVLDVDTGQFFEVTITVKPEVTSCAGVAREAVVE